MIVWVLRHVQELVRPPGDTSEMTDTESGLKWWMRYVIVPLIGGSGVVAIIVALISAKKDSEPTNSPKQSQADSMQQSSKDATSPKDSLRYPTAQRSVILDGLRWTIDDNGSEIDWQAANAYCGDLNLDGVSGWRLPSIHELRSLAEVNSSDYSVRKPFRLTGSYIWSSERRGDDASFYVFLFGTAEARGSVQQIHNRVLCVRTEAKPGEK